MDYVGKLCPFCHTAFTEEDDVVICSDCEMPHHKECWISNKGCTTFGCQGTVQGIAFEAEPAESSAPKYEIRDDGSDHLFCPKCGAEVEPGQVFCTHCGAQMKVSKVREVLNRGVSFVKKTASTVKEKVILLLEKFRGTAPLDPVMEAMIKTEAPFYIKNFSGLQSAPKYVTWNWPAFLLAPFWFMYRKMYIPGIVIAAVQFLLAALGGFISGILWFGIAALCGCMGNYVYYYVLSKKIMKAETVPLGSRQTYIQKNGDTDTLIPSIAAVVIVVLYILIL